MAADIEAVREGTGVPDLADLPLTELTDPADPVLAGAIRTARARRAGAGIVFAGFHGARRHAPGAGDASADETTAEPR